MMGAPFAADVTVAAVSENLITFFAVFKFFDLFICNYFENTQILPHPNRL
jgi:hypothetical protein